MGGKNCRGGSCPAPRRAAPAPAPAPIPPQQQPIVPEIMPAQNIPAAQTVNQPEESWSEWWHGKPPSTMHFPIYNKEQSQAFGTVLQQALSGLGQNKGRFDFSPIENQARENFSQKTIPSIAERFSALDAQRSSAFGQQLGQAGRGLETDLASMKAQYNLPQAELEQRLLLSLLGVGLSPQFESQFTPRQPGVKQNLTNAALQAIPYFGQFLSALLGGAR